VLFFWVKRIARGVACLADRSPSFSAVRGVTNTANKELAIKRVPEPDLDFASILWSWHLAQRKRQTGR
jgi:hypothetical protein